MAVGSSPLDGEPAISDMDSGFSRYIRRWNFEDEDITESENKS